MKRIYIPLPDAEARRALLHHSLQGQPAVLSDTDLARIVHRTDGCALTLSGRPATRPHAQERGRVKTFRDQAPLQRKSSGAVSRVAVK